MLGDGDARRWGRKDRSRGSGSGTNKDRGTTSTSLLASRKYYVPFESALLDLRVLLMCICRDFVGVLTSRSLCVVGRCASL